MPNDLGKYTSRAIDNGVPSLYDLSKRNDIVTATTPEIPKGGIDWQSIRQEATGDIQWKALIWIAIAAVFVIGGVFTLHRTSVYWTAALEAIGFSALFYALGLYASLGKLDLAVAGSARVQHLEFLIAVARHNMETIPEKEELQMLMNVAEEKLTGDSLREYQKVWLVKRMELILRDKVYAAKKM